VGVVGVSEAHGEFAEAKGAKFLVAAGRALPFPQKRNA
jgi:hypothetical protein